MTLKGSIPLSCCASIQDIRDKLNCSLILTDTVCLLGKESLAIEEDNNSKASTKPRESNAAETRDSSFDPMAFSGFTR